MSTKFVMGDKVIFNGQEATIGHVYTKTINSDQFYDLSREDGALITTCVIEDNISFPPVIEQKSVTSISNPATLPVAVKSDPNRYIVSVEFLSNPAGFKTGPRRYEYLAFGTLEELCEATHVVVCKQDHTTIDDLLIDSELVVARVLEVYPTSQQRYNGKLRWIVDTVHGVDYVNQNHKDIRSAQLKKDIKKRLEEITEMRILEEKVKGDPVAEELYRQLKELGDE